MSERLHSYSQIIALGHKALPPDFMDGVVLVEEKIDGSQFSFGVALDGELRCRSKGQEIHVDEPEGMFKLGVETVRTLAPSLTPGWVYRGEYLQKPKHNAIAYSRVPERNVILFDIDRSGGQDYLPYEEKCAEAARLGLELVPKFFQGRIESLDDLKAMLDRESCLGGTTPEGFVLKRYDLFGVDKKVVMAKYVTEAFKEVHASEWKKANPTRLDVMQEIIASLRTPARWQKAVIHLRERGTLEGSPKDIGALLREVPDDILKECEGEIRDRLFAYAWPHIRRGVTAGFPQWYKDQLAETAFAPTVPGAHND